MKFYPARTARHKSDHPTFKRLIASAARADTPRWLQTACVDGFRRLIFITDPRAGTVDIYDADVATIEAAYCGLWHPSIQPGRHIATIHDQEGLAAVLSIRQPSTEWSTEVERMWQENRARLLG